MRYFQRCFYLQDGRIFIQHGPNGPSSSIYLGTSPVLTPKTSSEVSCNRSPSGGGYVQLRLLAPSIFI